MTPASTIAHVLNIVIMSFVPAVVVLKIVGSIVMQQGVPGVVQVKIVARIVLEMTAHMNV